MNNLSSDPRTFQLQGDIQRLFWGSSPWKNMRDSKKPMDQGLQGAFELYSHGDAKRNYYRIIIKDGRFATLE